MLAHKEFNMRLPECIKCDRGSEVNGKSYCAKENVYSYLTRCIQKKALENYLKQKGDDDSTITLH